jgi:hypothetical protein
MEEIIEHIGDIGEENSTIFLFNLRIFANETG